MTSVMAKAKMISKQAKGQDIAHAMPGYALPCPVRRHNGLGFQIFHVAVGAEAAAWFCPIASAMARTKTFGR